MHVGIAVEKSMTERSVQLETNSVSNGKGEDILHKCAETQSSMPKTSPHGNKNLGWMPASAHSITATAEVPLIAETGNVKHQNLLSTGRWPLEALNCIRVTLSTKEGKSRTIDMLPTLVPTLL
jgi:hypothetical protein